MFAAVGLGVGVTLYLYNAFRALDSVTSGRTMNQRQQESASELPQSESNDSVPSRQPSSYWAGGSMESLERLHFLSCWVSNSFLIAPLPGRRRRAGTEELKRADPERLDGVPFQTREWFLRLVAQGRGS